ALRIKIKEDRRAHAIGDAVELQQREGQSASAASLRTGGEAFALKIREQDRRSVGAVKDKQRFITHAAKRNDLFAFWRVTDSALNKTNIDFKVSIVKPAQVFERAFRR